MMEKNLSASAKRLKRNEYIKNYRKRPEVQKRDKKHRQTAHAKEIMKKACEKHKPKHRKYLIKYRLRHRLACIEHYSQGKNCCCLCGTPDLDVLTIDHIDGGGHEHKRKVKNAYMPSVLYKSNFPEGYRILCMNCQWKEARRKNLFAGGNRNGKP